MSERGLSVLYIEDDEIMRDAVASRLERKFDVIYMCGSAEEGLIIFDREHIDLVLTDYMLPRMNGLDLISQIRQKDWDIPIILITGYADTDFLMEAINLGVTQFVPKPVNMRVLSSALNFAIQRVVLENMKRKNQEQELELLKYREKYHSSQQETAFRKELNALRNDYDRRVIDVQNKDHKKARWLVDLMYRGLDIMSGDTYSVHKINDHQLFCFILDAMGKGVGASVTSMVSTTYINHIVEHRPKDQPLSLQSIVQNFLTYIQGILLKEEILCASFIMIDFYEEKMTYAVFSMPKMLLQSKDGSLRSIKSNNIPIIKYLQDFTINEEPISDIDKMLICSDGLTEAGTDNTSYEQHIADDFTASATFSNFTKAFFNKFHDIDDDITILYLKRTGKPKWQKTITVTSSIKNLQILEGFFKDSIAELNISESVQTKLSIAFTEAIMNAFEHGNLEITSQGKHNSLHTDTYDEFLKERQDIHGHKTITCFVEYIDIDAPVLCIRVIDEGKGMPRDIKTLMDADPKLLCGRGIEIMMQYTDQIYYSESGNEIIMVKAI